MKKLVIIGTAAMAAIAGHGAARNLPRLDSSKFDFCYEFVESPANEDLDGNSKKDMSVFGGDGWLTIGGATSIGYANFNCSTHSRYIGSNQGADADGGVWRRYGISYETGFTIEARLTIWTDTGRVGAFALTASPNDSTVNALLNIRDGSVTWGSSGSTVLTNMTTKNVYHTYRIARAPYSDTFSVWIDGNLVAESLGNGLEYGNVLDRILLGSIGENWTGSSVVTYLRFTKGGYAPPTEKDMRRDSSEFDHKYEMDAEDTRFSPTASTSDWSLCSGEVGTATLADGILSVDQPSGKMRYYRTVGALDQNISAQSPFTFEIATRINVAWAGSSTGGRVVNFLLGTPRASCCFFIGTNTVQASDNTLLHTADNTDKMHVFRVSYKGEWPNTYVLYRDGEKIAEIGAFGMTAAYNYARFGIASTSTHGGAFDVDYIRWTTDGAFAPPKPKDGFAIIYK